MSFLSSLPLMGWQGKQLLNIGCSERALFLSHGCFDIYSSTTFPSKFTVTDALNQQHQHLILFFLIDFFQQFLVSHVGSPLFSCQRTHILLLACYQQACTEEQLKTVELCVQYCFGSYRYIFVLDCLMVSQHFLDSQLGFECPRTA